MNILTNYRCQTFCVALCISINVGPCGRVRGREVDKEGPTMNRKVGQRSFGLVYAHQRVHLSIMEYQTSFCNFLFFSFIKKKKKNSFSFLFFLGYVWGTWIGSCSDRNTACPILVMCPHCNGSSALEHWTQSRPMLKIDEGGEWMRREE